MIIELAERAERFERQAEWTNDRELWAVTQDAWEEAGSPNRAWYAMLRSRGIGVGTVTGALISRAQAQHIRRLLIEDEEAVDNNERARLELFDYFAELPARIYGYYSGPRDDEYVGDVITTYRGDRLGEIMRRGEVRRPFGGTALTGAGRVQYVVVKGDNGFLYNGTCAVDNGNYCKLRRWKTWLR